MEWKPWFWLVSRPVYVEDACGYSHKLLWHGILLDVLPKVLGIKIRDLEALSFELEDLSVWDGFEGVKSFEVEFSGVGNPTGGLVSKLI
ncbi:hypothetical protein Droror1_Dr00014439 [Drosera rotundifolia]